MEDLKDLRELDLAVMACIFKPVANAASDEHSSNSVPSSRATAQLGLQTV